MIDILYWWMLVLLPLPWLIARFFPRPQQPSAIVLPHVPQAMQGNKVRTPWWIKSMQALMWLCLVCACMRPVWYGEPVDINPEHRDLMLAIDLSGSMSIQDMKLDSGDYVDRLTTVKAVVSDFIAKRQGDRLGLVLFADHAYLQTPLTLDINTVAQQLKRTVLGLVGEKTALGEGIGIATKTFIKNGSQQRVLVLLSDGANTSGVIDPQQAAELAAQSGVTIYTIGVGAREMQQRGLLFSRRLNPSRDLDEKTLQQIARTTGGRYFRATDAQQLAQIYTEIDALQPIKNAAQRYRPQDEWFPYPLAMALILSMLLSIIRRRYA